MGWTNPRTWSVAEVLTAALMNTHLRDNLLETAVAKVTTAGDLVYATGANALARLGIGGNGAVLGSNGSTPGWTNAPGPLTMVDYTDAAAPAAPSSGRTRLYTVSGKPRFRPAAGADTPLVAGGTAWRLPYLGSGGEQVDLAFGAANTVLSSNGASAAPTWISMPAHAVVRKTAQESVTNSTTLQNDDHLLFAVGASEVWAWTCVLFYASAGGTTPDLKVAWTVPSGATVRWSALGYDDADGFGLYYQETSGASLPIGTAAVQATRALVLQGVVVNSTNAGNVQLQWAQNTSNGNATTVYDGSYLVAHRIA